MRSPAILFAFAFCAVSMAAYADESEADAEIFIAGITEAVPDNISPHQVTIKTMEENLPGDLLKYAEFYWMADRIEGNCKYLGQRSNIEMVGDLITWADAPLIMANHPDRERYLALIERVDSFWESLGEETFCPLAYRLLGPNGSLMGAPMRINNYMPEADQEKYMITPEGGVLWSQRDYCDNSFYLQPPADQGFHDYACEQAEKQGF